MATRAQQSPVKFLAVGRLGSTELHDHYTPNPELNNDQLLEECLKVLAENQLQGNSSGDLHFHALKQEDFVLFLQHGNTRLDELFELKLLEEINHDWNPEIRLSDFMVKMAEKPKKISRPPPKGPKLPSLEKHQQDGIIPTASTSSELTLHSHRKQQATSSVDQIKLMMAEDQRFKQRSGNTAHTAADAIKLQIMEQEKTSANTPKTQDTTTTQRDSGSEKNEKNKSGGIIVLGGDSTVAETKAENSAESAVVAEEMKKIKESSTNKKVFVVIILILAVVIFALVPALTQ